MALRSLLRVVRWSALLRAGVGGRCCGSGSRQLLGAIGNQALCLVSTICPINTISPACLISTISTISTINTAALLLLWGRGESSTPTAGTAAVGCPVPQGPLLGR